MAITTEELETLRDGLVRALATGALSVTHPDGRAMSYRSVAELRAALAYIDAALGNVTSQAGVSYIETTDEGC